MAPGERNADGFWGPPTATIDWCEANYEVTHYIAEFWNTVSNVFMIVPPLFGAMMALYDGLERRFIWCHLSLSMVGIGSWCFHGTLLYEMQLLDELPMIWGSAIMLYSLLEVDGKPRMGNRAIQVFLLVYCAVVTGVYLTVKDPLFHEVAYALMVLAMVASSVRILRKLKHSMTLFLCGMVSYVVGFLIWNLDNIFCQHHRDIRASLGYPVKVIWQGHAWWHVLAGTGTYMSLLFCIHARAHYLKKTTRLQMAGHLWPFVRVTSAA